MTTPTLTTHMDNDWLNLPYADWADTCETLHAWTQIVGKVKMELAAPESHWWHVALYVTPRGLTTGSVPYTDLTFQIDFDLHSHELQIVTSHGASESLKLEAKSVKVFYTEFMAAMKRLGIEVKIDTLPKEVNDPIRFDEDTVHCTYDTAAVERFRRVLIQCDRVLRGFRGKFCGHSSPVHFFWGSFDLAMTRLSGSWVPSQTDAVHQTAEQEFSVGWWPGSPRYPQPAFYAYAVPAPSDYYDPSFVPGVGHYDPTLGEFILNYADAIRTEKPEKTIMEFADSAYARAASLGGWDRDRLECLILERIHE